MTAHNLFRDGIPIDGIGSQSHLPSGGASRVQGALTALAGSGVSEVAMTELEIVGNAVSDWVTAVKACLAVTSCVGITIWKLINDDVWAPRNSAPFFDGNLNRTAVYNAVISTLQEV